MSEPRCEHRPQPLDCGRDVESSLDLSFEFRLLGQSVRLSAYEFDGAICTG